MTIWELWWNQNHRKKFMKYLKGKEATILFQFWWSKESTISPIIIKIITSFHCLVNRKHSFIFLCNTQKEMHILSKLGLRAEFINHNAFADEHIFSIQNTEKKYDAIYNAKLSLFKRHSLCRKIGNLGLITYVDNRILQNIYFAVLKKILPSAQWLNWQSQHYQRLTHNEVVTTLNKSKIGLCLSKAEGAMYASIEYLLCGLPIVSTLSKGGRDIFFDERFVAIAKPSATAVAHEVTQLIDRNIPPEDIRSTTLKKMSCFRERFIELLNKLHQKNSSPQRVTSFRDDNLYFHSPPAQEIEL